MYIWQTNFNFTNENVEWYPETENLRFPETGIQMTKNDQTLQACCFDFIIFFVSSSLGWKKDLRVVSVNHWFLNCFLRSPRGLASFKSFLQVHKSKTRWSLSEECFLLAPQLSANAKRAGILQAINHCVKLFTTWISINSLVWNKHWKAVHYILEFERVFSFLWVRGI